MPNALHQFARATFRQARERGVARDAVTDAYADLDQFVCGERAVELREDSVGKAGVA